MTLKGRSHPRVGRPHIDDARHRGLRQITIEMHEPAPPPANNQGVAHTRGRISHEKGFTMSFTTVTSLRSSLAQRRVARTKRRRTACELASYRTPAERLELDLMLGRHTAEETAEIEAILNKQAASVSYRLGA
jgi:hypothetical protein